MDLYVVIVTNSAHGAWVHSDHHCIWEAIDAKAEAIQDTKCNVIIETIKIEV